MKLLHGLVQIKPELPPEKTESGILLVSNSLKELPPIGEVVGVAKEITDIKVGDRVVYSVYAGVELDEETVLVPYKSVMAVL